jgi:hypothetical protein
MEDHFEYESVVAAAAAAGGMEMSLVRKGDESIVMKKKKRIDSGGAAIGVVSRIPIYQIYKRVFASARGRDGRKGRGISAFSLSFFHRPD